MIPSHTQDSIKCTTRYATTVEDVDTIIDNLIDLIENAEGQRTKLETSTPAEVLAKYPGFKYITQDVDGQVKVHTGKPKYDGYYGLWISEGVNVKYINDRVEWTWSGAKHQCFSNVMTPAEALAKYPGRKFITRDSDGDVKVHTKVPTAGSMWWGDPYDSEYVYDVKIDWNSLEWTKCVYPKPITPAEALAKFPGHESIAMDENGQTYVFKGRPRVEISTWTCENGTYDGVLQVQDCVVWPSEDWKECVFPEAPSEELIGSWPTMHAFSSHVDVCNALMREYVRLGGDVDDTSEIVVDFVSLGDAIREGTPRNYGWRCDGAHTLCHMNANGPETQIRWEIKDGNVSLYRCS